MVAPAPPPRPAALAWVVPPALHRWRLDQFVAALWAQTQGNDPVTRGEVQRWIDQGGVTVNGQPGRASQRIVAGARVEVVPAAAPTTDVIPDPTVPFTLLFEDDYLLVLDKPSGLVVHPARGHRDGTLVHGLVAHGTLAPEDERGAPDGLPRPGIVHRLDKGTSGVMVVAKDARTREGLKALFAEHRIERSYVAITVGTTLPRTITRPHGRHPTDRIRFTSRLLHHKLATTHVAVEASLAGGRASLVRCTLETGRTHQIRVHLAEVAGTPVLGDPVYGKPPTDRLLRTLGHELGHQALHAEVLGFVHPITGKTHRWTTPLPEDLARVLARLRAETSIRSS